MARIDSDSSLQVYLREITQTELLTAAEEVALAARIKAGDERARATMIKANLRLVVKIAQEYSGYGLPLADLISEGNIGLMKAVERFDPAKGGKLSTYGSWWIKQSIKRALANQSKTIRLPIHMVDKIAKMRRISALLSECLGREPSEEELSEELGLPRRKLSLLKRASQRPVSLDAPVNEDDTVGLGDVIGDDKTQSPLEVLVAKNIHQQLDGLLAVLNTRERTIVELRFGLKGRRPRTLEEVGSKLAVTRERIRQIQNIALTKMSAALRKKEMPMPQAV